MVDLEKMVTSKVPDLDKLNPLKKEGPTHNETHVPENKTQDVSFSNTKEETHEAAVGAWFKKDKNVIRLEEGGIQEAVSNPSRLQHAFKHASDINQFRGLNWNKEVMEKWKQYNADILRTATASFDNVIGPANSGLRVKGFYKLVDGQNVVVYLYKEGPNIGKIATTVVLNANSMIKFGLP